MTTTKSRIEALERVHGVEGDELTVVINRFGTRRPGEPVSSYSTPEPNAQHVQREPNEDFDSFRERAISTMRGKRRGFFVVIEN